MVPKNKKSRKKLVATLDRVFSEYILRRDKHCICCGSTENLQCGHLFSRVNYSTRWDERNANAQCRNCNLTHEYNPHVYTLAYIHQYGLEQYEDIAALHRKTQRIKDADVIQLIEKFKKLKEEL